MKAEELMRFDWVRLTDDTPRQVDWIRSGEVGLFWNKTVTPPYLEPIPLTPEILFKNGFRKRPHQGNSWINDESDARYVCFSIGESLNLWGGCDQDYVWITVQYVHQLQHALRLCGIDKTIEL